MKHCYIRRFTAWLTVLLLVIGCCPIHTKATEYRHIPITYRGRTVMGGEAKLIDSVTYVPFRAVCNALGEGDVTWEDSDKTASYRSDTLTITAQQGKPYLEANGRYLYCEQGIRNLDSRLYVPIRAMAKAFGVTVTWSPSYHVALDDGEALVCGEDYYDETDLYWLSRIISAESRGETLAGMIAVGNVVMNRVNDSRYPSDIREVIFQSGQFTPVQNGSVYRSPVADAVIAAKLCLDGAVVTADALFFCNPAISVGTWIQNNRPYRMTIGNHAFYA